MRNWAHHNNTKVPEVYDLYAMAHTASYKKAKAFSKSDLDHQEKFTNICSHNKLVRYKEVGKVRKGEDFNPSKEPLDPELVMVSGGRRPHGSITIRDGLIRCRLTLREIKAHRTSSCPKINPHPWSVNLAIEVSYTDSKTLLHYIVCVLPSMITILTRSGVAGCSSKRETTTTQDAAEELLQERDGVAAETARAVEEKTTRLLAEERA
ncbi:hypothetical protein ZWY2020_029012 [Hordeum vulgare]|nr:hypothetical protein ZWY2020_029012 [Hordeum vulgare]